MNPAGYILKKAIIGKQTANASSPRANKPVNIQKTAIAVGLGAFGLGVAYVVAKRIIKDIRKNRSERKFTQETQQALLFRSALNPSGISWLHWMDGTKEKSVYELAAKVTNFKKVQQEYRNLFNRSLVSDLESELSTDEYSKFMNIINSAGIHDRAVDSNTYGSGYPSTSTSDNEVRDKVILIKNATKVYEKFTWYPWGSVKKIEPYYFINHPATGNIKKVPVSYTLSTDFLETKIKTVEGSVKTVYVKKDDVTLVSKDDFLANYRDKYTKVLFRDNEF